MITLKIDCCMCGKESADEILVEKISQFTIQATNNELAKIGWIVQINGDSLDVYCCEECAH